MNKTYIESLILIKLSHELKSNSRLETKLFHTLGFTLCKVFPKPTRLAISQVYEEGCTGAGGWVPDTLTRMQKIMGMRLGTSPYAYDAQDHIQHSKPNLFRYGGYRD